MYIILCISYCNMMIYYDDITWRWGVLESSAEWVLGDVTLEAALSVVCGRLNRLKCRFYARISLAQPLKCFYSPK